MRTRRKNSQVANPFYHRIRPDFRDALLYFLNLPAAYRREQNFCEIDELAWED